MKPQESDTNATSNNNDNVSEHVWETFGHQVPEYLSYWINLWPLGRAFNNYHCPYNNTNLTGNLRDIKRYNQAISSNSLCNCTYFNTLYKR